MSSEANHPVVVEKNLPMRARDGVTLYADVYRPAAQGRFPVLVIRTPYDKSVDNALTEKDYFPPRGYVVVVQDTRSCPAPTDASGWSGSPTWRWCSTRRWPPARPI